MFNDLRKTAVEGKKLKRRIVSFSAKRNQNGLLKNVIDDILWDMSPILFEVCLMGHGRARHVL